MSDNDSVYFINGESRRSLVVSLSTSTTTANDDGFGD